MIIKKSKSQRKENKAPSPSTKAKKPGAGNNKIIEPDMPVIKERQERRRGDRRRGYRRIDDRNVISRAHEEANEIKEKAAKEGFEYGLGEAQHQISLLQNAMEEFIQAKQLAYADVSKDISEIAVKVAEKIIKIQVTCDDGIILNIIKGVVAELGSNESKIIISTHPNSVNVARENIPNIFRGANSKTHVEVVPDESVDAGSCIVTTNNGMVDAAFSTQLAVIKKALNSSL